MANTQILLNGFSIVGNAHTNTNASNGGELMIRGGDAVFEGDDIIVLMVENANPDGSLNEDSIITGLSVYDNATEYYHDNALYTYSAAPGDGIDVSAGRSGMGDTYLQVDASPLTSSDAGAPTLGDLTMVAGVDILAELASSNGPFEVATFQDIDIDGDGTVDVAGDGFFSADANSLAATIETLLRGEFDWRKLSAAARRRHRQHFSDQAMAAATAEIYRRVSERC